MVDVMGIKRFPVGADEGLVERFDEVAYRRRVSRNRLIVELMEKAVALGPPSPEGQAAMARAERTNARAAEVIAELQEIADAVCSHPKEKRKNLGYFGTRCEECGGMVK